MGSGVQERSVNESDLAAVFTDVREMGYRGFPVARDVPCGLCGEIMPVGSDSCGVHADVDNRFVILVCHFHCAEENLGQHA